MSFTNSAKPPVVSLLHRAQARWWACRHHIRIAARTLPGRFTRPAPFSQSNPPAVTLFITTKNNKDLLDLTIRSAIHFTNYPNYRIVVADNGSSDDTLKMLAELQHGGYPIDVVCEPDGRAQHLWYDYMASTVQTPLWVAIHDDIMLTRHGWLERLVCRMEQDDNLQLLAGDKWTNLGPGIEPTGGKLVNNEFALSTWIFAARRSLHNRCNTSFEFYSETSDDGVIHLWDQGGRVIRDLQQSGGFASMDAGYERYFYHFGNMSWSYHVGMPEHRRWFKDYQKRDASRHLRKFRIMKCSPVCTSLPAA